MSKRTRSLSVLSLLLLVAFGPAWCLLVATEDMALLHFTVRAPNGKLLAGANIALTTEGSEERYVGNTNDKGEVDLLVKEGGNYKVVWNSPEGELTLEQQIPVGAAPGAQEGSFRIQFREQSKVQTSESVLFDVSVTNFDGRAIPRAQILLKARRGDKLFEGKADADGRLQLRADKGVTYAIQYLSLTGPYEVGEVTVPNDPRILSGPLSVQYDDNTLELRNVFFDTGKASLRRESFKELDKLVVGMKTIEPGLVVEIAGHTDNVGGEEYNLKLSDERAGSVRKYLTDRGIAAERVQAKGYGMSQPVESNDSEAGRASNRRTEVRILGGKQ